MSVKMKPNFEALSYSDEQLDYVYSRLSPETRKKADLNITIALAGQGLVNVRPQSTTWLRVQREVMRTMLCEAEETVLDAGLDSDKFETFCDSFAETYWTGLDLDAGEEYRAE